MIYLLLILFVILFPFLVFYIYYRFIKHIKPVGKIGEFKKGFFLKRLYIDFPKRFIFDMLSKDRAEFNDTGFRLVVGEQGSGKTITVVYLLLMYKKIYEKLKIKTNMCYKFEDDVLHDWTDLVYSNNGIYGEIDVLDEVQNWFNSLESKDFPVEMMQEITQQRKQKKMILGTSQVWQRVAKPIREQVSLLYKPLTIFGCLTFVRIYKPYADDQGSIESMKFRGCFFFVHSEEIRNAFDTYKKIETMSLKGFKPLSERLQSSTAFPMGCVEVQTSQGRKLKAK